MTLYESYTLKVRPSKEWCDSSDVTLEAQSSDCFQSIYTDLVPNTDLDKTLSVIRSALSVACVLKASVDSQSEIWENQKNSQSVLAATLDHIWCGRRSRIEKAKELLDDLLQNAEDAEKVSNASPEIVEMYFDEKLSKEELLTLCRRQKKSFRV